MTISEKWLFLLFGGVLVRLLRDSLKGKYVYFSKRNMLADDGSFYCADKFLIERLEISDNTIKRARIFLKEAGEINYAIGKHKGAATRYWITPKGAKMEPFEQYEEGAKISAKEANLVAKESQNGSLNNKVVIKNENKNMPDIPFFTEEEKEGIRAFAKSYGPDQVTKMLSDKGCNLESLKQILEGILPCKE